MVRLLRVEILERVSRLRQRALVGESQGALDSLLLLLVDLIEGGCVDPELIDEPCAECWDRIPNLPRLDLGRRPILAGEDLLPFVVRQMPVGLRLDQCWAAAF